MKETQITKTIYGPVKSWRFGDSLGVDPIFHSSTCSFNCVYCQLGNIQKHTQNRQIFVETHLIRSHILEFLNENINFDVITISGNGEPTLALNLEDIILTLKELTNKPVYILTNSTLLGDLDVVRALQKADRVIAKLDAITDDELQYINRPVASTADEIITNLINFRTLYAGVFDLQIMMMTYRPESSKNYADIIKKINPQHVQINTPTRPYPLVEHRENRGLHKTERNYESRQLKRITPEELQLLEKEFQSLLGNIDVQYLQKS